MILLTQSFSGCFQADIAAAARIIAQGGMVAVPTETVYGLAADALSEDAVRRIFEAKRRPQDNPVIVHVASADQILPLVTDVPPMAKELIEIFWPGPLTLVLPKSRLIPDAVCAGLSTVAVRFPSHPVMQKLISAAGLPLAAPSANLSGKPSPTCVAHVLQDLDGRIDAVIDGGVCQVGVESTVVSFENEEPTLLRPGGISLEQLQLVLGKVNIAQAVLQQMEQGQVPAAPGMKYRHYAPSAKLVLVKGSLNAFVEFVNQRADLGVAALCFSGEERGLKVPAVPYGAQDNPQQQAQLLFGALRQLDALNCTQIYARCPLAYGPALAVYNRLLRAAEFEVLRLG